MRKTCLFLASIALSVVPSEAKEPAKPSSKPDQETIAGELKALAKAAYLEDYDLIVESMPEPAVKEIGGKDAVREGLEKTLGMVKSAGVSFVDFKVGELDGFAGSEHEFFLAPTVIVLKQGEETRSEPGNQFGVRKKGASAWKYADTTGLNLHKIHEWYPDFPSHRGLEAHTQKDRDSKLDHSLLVGTWFTTVEGESTDHFLISRKADGTYRVKMIYIDKKRKIFSYDDDSGRWYTRGKTYSEVSAADENEVADYKVTNLTKEKFDYVLPNEEEDDLDLSEEKTSRTSLPAPPEGFKKVNLDEFWEN